MVDNDEYLKTQTVAKALGLSVSTIKRWVDSGAIHAARTVGKHRLIPRREAVRMAHELGKGGDEIRDLAGFPGVCGIVVENQTRDRLCRLLREGQSQQARQLIQSVYLSGCGAASLADDLIHPVMASIGHGWMVGALDIYQEHQASHTVGSAIMDLISRVDLERPAPGPLALGAATEGDPYVLSSLLSELLLRERGWDVRNLGVNLPLRSLANATLEYRPKLVFLSINYLRDPDHFVREYVSFHESASSVNAAVIVGGQALVPEIRSRLVYTAFGDRMINLAEFARQFSSTSRVAGEGVASSGKAARPIVGSYRDYRRRGDNPGTLS